MKCEGFTRPECEPCPFEDAQPTDYLVMGMKETRNLCELCRSRLIPIEDTPW